MTTLAVLHLAHQTPPLSLNGRQHWHVKRRVSRALRDEAHAWARLAFRAPLQARIAVTLHYVPKDSRRRDADNLVATSKPLVDGLVDAGVVPDDTPQWLDHRMPVIDPPDSRALTSRLYLLVETL